MAKIIKEKLLQISENFIFDHWQDGRNSKIVWKMKKW